MSDKTNLADLLALNLHKFEDEVRNIVDKATKELSMEKTLKVSNKSRDIICGKIYIAQCIGMHTLIIVLIKREVLNPALLFLQLTFQFACTYFSLHCYLIAVCYIILYS